MMEDTDTPCMSNVVTRSSPSKIAAVPLPCRELGHVIRARVISLRGWFAHVLPRTTTHNNTTRVYYSVPTEHEQRNRWRRAGIHAERCVPVQLVERLPDEE